MKQQVVIPSGANQTTEQPCCSTGKYYAYASTLSIYVYRSEDMQLERIINYPENTILCIAGNPNINKEIAVFSSDGIIRIWNLESGNRLFTIEAKGLKIETMRWDLEDPNKIFCTTETRVYETLNKEGLFRELSIGDKLPKGSVLLALEQCTFKPNLVVLGYELGVSGEGLIFLHDTATKTTSKQKLVSPIVSIDWDPCSSDFILMCLKSGNLLLYDITNGREVSQFTKQPIGSTKAAFFIGKTCPGGFVTISSRGDILHLWNVAQTTFMRSLKIGISSNLRTCQFISTPSSFPKEARILASFANGSVAIYSPTKEKMLWHTTGGHTETVFACDFNHADANVLATAAYDQTIRIWNIADHPKPSCTAVLPKMSSTIYSVCWSPNGTHIACGTANGQVGIYDALKCKLISTMNEHTEPCYSVKWNMIDTRLIASAGQDKKCVLFTVEGEIIQVIQQTDASYGVAWDPFNRYRLATTCEDRLFYLWTLFEPSNSEELLSNSSIQVKKVNQFKGHTAKVFNIVWNEKVKDVVATGSDDHTVRIWNLEKGKSEPCIGVLNGHKSRVRGLLWHKDAPWLLLSSSWDATVRLWDTINMTCIQTLNCHHSDVYAISMHIERPFLLATTSRDSTVRIWNLIGNSFDSLQHLPTQMWVKYILGKEVEEGGESDTMSQRKFNFKVLEDKLSEHERAGSALDESNLGGLGLLLNYWWPSCYVKHLFQAMRLILCSRSQSKTQAVISETAEAHLDELIQYVEGGSSQFLELLLYFQNIHRCMHGKIANKVLQVEAQYLQSFMKKKFMGVGMGRSKREEYTREAAKLYLRSGNVESYCEIMCELNEWDKALAMAPMVGQVYWKDLMKRKAELCTIDHRSNEGDAFKDTSKTLQESEAYLIAGHKIDKLVDMYRELGDNDSAFLLASVASDGGYGLGKEVQDDNAPGSNSLQASPESNPQPNDVLFQPLRRKSLAPLQRAPAGGGVPDNAPGSPGFLGTAQSHSKSISPIHAIFKSTMYDIQNSKAQKYKSDGDIIASACCSLSVNDVHGGINMLLMGCEFQLAALLAYYLLDKEDPRTAIVVRFLLMRLEGLGQYALCNSVIEAFGQKDKEEEEFHILRKHLVVKNEVLMNGNPQPSERSTKDDMKAFLHSKNYTKCALAFLEHLDATFSKAYWSMEEDIDPLWEYANSVNCENLENKLQKNFLCAVFSIASLKFMWMNQDYLCAHAYTLAIDLLRSSTEVNLPKDFEVYFQIQLLSFLAQSGEGVVRTLGRRELKNVQEGNVPVELKAVWQQSVEWFGSGTYIPLPCVPTHSIIPTGSKLPSMEKSQKSLFRTIISSSQSVKLEDGLSFISVGEAVMWQWVCSFSPLGTGKILQFDY